MIKVLMPSACVWRWGWVLSYRVSGCQSSTIWSNHQLLDFIHTVVLELSLEPCPLFTSLMATFTLQQQQSRGTVTETVWSPKRKMFTTWSLQKSWLTLAID